MSLIANPVLSHAQVYYQGAVGAFVVFDVTESASFDAVQVWKEDVDNKLLLPNGQPIPVVLLANKVGGDFSINFTQIRKIITQTNQLSPNAILHVCVTTMHSLIPRHGLLPSACKYNPEVPSNSKCTTATHIYIFVKR